jgi:cation:H+ antiporter
MVWIEFTACGVLLLASAYALCREGMALAGATHIEEGFVGILFLAVATSFPELVVGVSSVTYLKNFALGYGDLVGSVMINSMLIVGVEFYAGRGRVLSKASHLNIITVSIWAAVALVITLSAMVRRSFGGFSLGSLGLESFFIAGLYFFYLTRLQKKNVQTSEYRKKKERNVPGIQIRGMWMRFLLLLVWVMFLGVWMSALGDKLAVSTGLSHTFVGSTLLALITSFPEIAVTFAAVRVGSVEMALGNVFGSNLFDLVVVSILDIFDAKPITGYLTTGHIWLTTIAALIPIVFLTGMKTHSNARRRLGLDVSLAFILGLSGLVISFFVE